MQHNGWDHALKVTADGRGLVGHAGAILLRKAADQLGLTAGLILPLVSGVRTFHYVYPRPVMLDEIEIHGRETRQRMPQVAYNRNCLQEYLGQHHCGSEVKVDAALVEPSHQRTQQAKIAMPTPSSTRSS